MSLRDPMPQEPEPDVYPYTCPECLAPDGRCARGCPEATLPCGFADEDEPDYDNDEHDEEEEP